jgi:IstB-like ATP binding protein
VSWSGLGLVDDVEVLGDGSRGLAGAVACDGGALKTEVDSRDSHGGQARIKAARFPARKTIEEFDFAFQASLRRETVLHLAQLDFLAGRENIVLLGPPGTGKTHPRCADTMARMPRLVMLLTALTVLAPPTAVSAQTTTRGSTLEATPFPANQGSDCDAYFAYGGPVHNPYGATTCSYYQGFVYSANAGTDPRTGFVPSDGIINTVTVKVGANPAPLQFVILRQLTNAQLGAQSGEPKCCFFVGETAPVQPAPNTTTTFTVNLPVENNRQPNIITQDAIGFSAPAGGTLPLAFVPGQFSPASYTPNGLTSSSFHPKLGPENGTNTGGAFADGQQGGLDVLLQYTFTPAAGVISPGGGVSTLRPTDITTIGGSVLRPIGGNLDVVLNCLQVTCAGSVKILSRAPVAAARASKNEIRSLGTSTFTLTKGNGLKVKVKLNTLGRKLAKHKSTKVKVVVDLGKAGTTTKNLTLEKAKASSTR